MAKPRLIKEGNFVLQKAWDKGRRSSRQDIKKLGKESEAITSQKSHEIHKTNWQKFAEWADKKHNIKRLGKITKEIVKEYLQEEAKQGGRDGKGASYKTLQTYLTAINKVMVSSQRWTESDKPTMTKWKQDIEIRKDSRDVYKSLTGKEWIERNPKEYKKYNQVIETIRAFGLRSKELKELNTKSFIKDKNGKLYVQTIGKGGKYRIAECASDMNNKMMEWYGGKAQEVNDIKEFKGYYDEETAKEYLRNQIRNSKKRLNIKYSKSERMPKHIFRADYAQRLLNEKIEELKGVSEGVRGYSTFKTGELRSGNLRRYETQIGAYKGNAEAFREVSRNLGHNRLDVLLRYL